MDISAIIDAAFRGAAIMIWFFIFWIIWRVIKAVFRGARTLPKHVDSHSLGRASAAVNGKAKGFIAGFKDGFRSGS